jgi:hypothetical protein
MNSRKIVVSIDFGTTYSGIAWAETTRVGIPNLLTVMLISDAELIVAAGTTHRFELAVHRSFSTSKQPQSSNRAEEGFFRMAVGISNSARRKKNPVLQAVRLAPGEEQWSF